MTKRETMKTISDVADRAIAFLQSQGITQDKLSIVMDLDYVDDIIPLDFDVLLAFDDANFGHDIAGIYRHFDRQTKTMGDCFCPRSAKQEPRKRYAGTQFEADDEITADVTLVHIETGDRVDGRYTGATRYEIVAQAFKYLTGLEQWDDDQAYKVLAYDVSK